MSPAQQEVPVSVSDPLSASTVEFVIRHCGLQDRFRVDQTANETVLQTPEGPTLTGLNTICRYLVAQTSKPDALLGSGAAEQALVAEWLSFKSALSYTGEEQLAKINSHLASRVYLCGNHLTLADLATFSALHRPVSNFPAAQVDHFCNLVRYMDLLQHTVDTSNTFPAIQVAKPPFKPPLPLPTLAKEAKPPAEAGKKTPAQDLSGQPKGTALENGAAAGAPPAAKVPAAAEGVAPAPAKGKPGSQTSSAEASSKKEKQKGEKKGGGKAEPVDADPAVDVLDLRVGKILSIERHPNAESLYVEQIDLGEEQPRQVVSGLVKFVPIEQMRNRRVIVVANMKPAKMRDIVSAGMVLCASNAAHDQVDPLKPPDSAAIGERVSFEGYNGNEGKPEQLNPKKKPFEKIAPFLRTTADGIAQFKGVSFQTSVGPVTASIPNGTIS